MRGPDWKWNEQDGGVGCVGTLVELTEQESERSAVVQWDAGNQSNYRCGLDGKFDLRVYDTKQIGKFCSYLV